jgi:hypothetical protein
LLETHHPAFSCPLCRTFANLEEDVEIDAASFELIDYAAEKDTPAPATTPEDAEMLLLSPNLGRERDGAETEVEPEMGFGNSLRRIPVPPSIIDLAEESDDDRDAFMVEDPSHDYDRHYLLSPKARAWCLHRLPSVKFLGRAVRLSLTPRMQAEIVRRMRRIEQRSGSVKISG